MNNLPGYFQLQWQDWGKALVMAVGSAALTAILTALNNDLIVNWSTVWHVSAITAITYILKNLLTNSQGQFLGAI